CSQEGIQASTSSSSSSSSSSDSDEEKVIAKENKPLTPDKQQNHPSENGSVAKRKKLDSSSSSSSTSSDSGDEGSKSGKDNEVPGSDVDSMWNNASEKSDSSSESGDEIQLVACIPTTSLRSTAKEVTIDEVVLDDDDDDAVAAPCTPTKSKTSSPSPKQPTIRTLSISGVSVRTDGEQLTTTPEKGVGASSERAFPRTLPISGVSVRADGTPIRPHNNAFRKSFPNVGHFMSQRHQSNSSEQLERRRELARRKFDLAEQKRAQFTERKKRSALSARPGAAGTATNFRNGKKVLFKSVVKTSSKSPLKRSKSSGNCSKAPSYTVAKVFSKIS
ncbi:hypothetical protein ANCCAN_20693, partial [Ancylostoma caninum]